MRDETSSNLNLKNISYYLLLPILLSSYDFIEGEGSFIEPDNIENIYLFQDIEHFNRYITLGIVDKFLITIVFKDKSVLSYYILNPKLLDDIKFILESKYSQVSKEFKENIFKYLSDKNLNILEGGVLNPVICILEPEPYMPHVANSLDVELNLLKEVGELGSHLYLTNEIMQKETKESVSIIAEHTIITKVILESEKTKLKVSIKGSVVEATFIAKESVGLDYALYKVHIEKQTPVIYTEGPENSSKEVTEFLSQGGYLLISPSSVVDIL